jgi:hypothetical protein
MYIFFEISVTSCGEVIEKESTGNEEVKERRRSTSSSECLSVFSFCG